MYNVCCVKNTWVVCMLCVVPCMCYVCVYLRTYMRTSCCSYVCWVYVRIYMYVYTYMYVYVRMWCGEANVLVAELLTGLEGCSFKLLALLTALLQATYQAGTVSSWMAPHRCSVVSAVSNEAWLSHMTENAQPYMCVHTSGLLCLEASLFILYMYVHTQVH